MINGDAKMPEQKMVMEKLYDILKNPSDPSVTEEEREALQRLQDLWKKINDGIKPFTVLLSQQQKGEGEIRKAISEVLFGMYFFSAQTSDGICSVKELMDGTLKTATAQLDLATQEYCNAMRQAKQSNFYAKMALLFPLASLIVSGGFSMYYGHCARIDSETSTAAIVSAIVECKSQSK